LWPIRRKTLLAVGIFLVLALVTAARCLHGAPEEADGSGDNDSAPDPSDDSSEETSDDGTDGDEAEASYDQKDHTGCQPGEINKDGECTVAFEGANAEIFDAKNLTPVTTSNTSLGGARIPPRPADNGSYPAAVMIHEWWGGVGWGLNDNIRHMADVLAGHGYTVFAVDLYDSVVATESSRASELAGQVRDNPDESVTKLADATEALRASEYTTDQVASLG